MGVFIKHIPCEFCGSSDAGSLYADGSTHCFSCGKTTGGNGVERHDDDVGGTVGALLHGSYSDIPKRGLREETLRKFVYQLGEYKGSPCHIANYRDSTGKIVAQKVRGAGKTFKFLGDAKSAVLFGQHLWGSGGKSVVITEGEIDAMSVSQAFNLKYPVVSIKNGANGALKDIQGSYDWLDTFEKIVLCFDDDDPGRKAVEEVAPMLPPGKAFIMKLPRKDANEVLVADGSAPIVQAYWNATQYRPDGIKEVSELRESVLHPVSVNALPYPWAQLNDTLGGVRQGELVTFCAGSGLGKSTIARELLYHILVKHGESCGAMFLEESNEFTVKSLIGIHLSKPLTVKPDSVTKVELEEAFDLIASKSLYVWDHFGSNDMDDVISKMRFMNKVLGCKWVFLDHLSILVSGSAEGDERRTIDAGMTKLRTLVSETGMGLILVSHLKRPSGDKGHEDGAVVSLGQLRGSAAIGQLSDAVIGLQKDADDPTGDAVSLMVLKNRWSGARGAAGRLTYSRETGRLTDCPF